MSKSRCELNFIQTEMPVLSKSVAEFYKKLGKLDKFDIHEGVQKSYQKSNQGNNLYYIKIGRIEE
jgi:hypothetical protein